MYRRRSSYGYSSGDQEGKNYFFYEIRSMMHSHGDVKEPNDESVHLMYSILCNQMNILLIEADNVACFRGSEKTISHEDILFLMTKNKVKLKRLLQYLEVLDMRPSSLQEGGSWLSKGKRVNECMEYLAFIEDCEEFTSLLHDASVIDYAARKRLERRDSMICLMSVEEYKEFSEKTVRASFCPNQRQDSFKKWLLQDHVTKFELTKLAVTIIDFLARETIAEVIDVSLLIKSKKLGGIQGFPYIHCTNPVDLLAHSRNNFHLATSEALEGMIFDVKSNDSVSINATKTVKNVKSTSTDHLTKNNQELDKSSNAPDRDQSIPLTNDTKSNSDTESNISSVQFSENPSDDTNTWIIVEDSASQTAPSDDNGPSGFGKKIEDSNSCNKENSFSHPLKSEDNSKSCEFQIEDKSSKKMDDDVLSLSSITDLLPSCVQKSTGSEGMTQKTFAISHLSQESNIFENISEDELMAEISDTRDCSNDVTKNIAQISCDVPAHAVTREVAAVNYNYNRTAITPEEIREAFARFQEPSPVVLFLSDGSIRRKTKLICLADSTSFDVI